MSGGQTLDRAVRPRNLADRRPRVDRVPILGVKIWQPTFLHVVIRAFLTNVFPDRTAVPCECLKSNVLFLADGIPATRRSESEHSIIFDTDQMEPTVLSERSNRGILGKRVRKALSRRLNNDAQPDGLME